MKKIILVMTCTLLLLGCNSKQQKNSVNNEKNELDSLTNIFHQSVEKLISKGKVTITGYSALPDYNHRNYFCDSNGNNCSFRAVYSYKKCLANYDNKNRQYKYDFYTNNTGILDIDHDTEYLDTYDNKYYYNDGEKVLPLTDDTIKFRMDELDNGLFKKEGYISRYVIQDGIAKKYKNDKFDKNLKISEYGQEGGAVDDEISSSYSYSLIELLLKSNIAGQYEMVGKDELGNVCSAFDSLQLGSIEYYQSYIGKQSKVDGEIILNFTLDKESSYYKEMVKASKNSFDNNSNYDVYTGDQKIQITIDKNGYLKKYECTNTKNFFNDSWKDIKVPEIIVIEFSYE